MTSYIGANVWNQVQNIVGQRSRIWQRYDEVHQQQEELHQYAGQFSSSTVSQELPDLSSTSSPPDELAAAVWQLKQESEKINQARARIRSYHDEIASTKQQFFMVVGTAVLVVVIFLIILFNR